MAVSEPPGEEPPGDNTDLLVAALNHAWAWYDARTGRGLTVINYFLVASAVLATAYVSAINGKHYPIAVVLALSGMALTAVTYLAGLVERKSAVLAQAALFDIQDKIAGELRIDAIRIIKTRPGTTHTHAAVILAFGAAFLLDIGSLLYALIR